VELPGLYGFVKTFFEYSEVSGEFWRMKSRADGFWRGFRGMESGLVEGLEGEVKIEWCSGAGSKQIVTHT
jgi:hypothetical protein